MQMIWIAIIWLLGCITLDVGYYVNKRRAASWFERIGVLCAAILLVAFGK